MSTPIKLLSPLSEKKPTLQLYVAHGCPFCHRVLLAMQLTGLNKYFAVSFTEDIKTDEGWQFDKANEPLFAATDIKTLYSLLAADNRYDPLPTSVPVLADVAHKHLLSQSSSDMVRLISSGFYGEISPTKLNHNLLVSDTAQLDNLNQSIHNRLNRAVYQTLNHNNQVNYERHISQLFAYLDELEQHLQAQLFMLGDTITEADVFLLPTLLRFDAVYYLLFYCSKRKISQYPNLSAYIKRCLAIEGVRDTFNLERTMLHYYQSSIHIDGKVKKLNALGVTPVVDCDF